MSTDIDKLSVAMREVDTSMKGTAAVNRWPAPLPEETPPEPQTARLPEWFGQIHTRLDELEQGLARIERFLGVGL